MSFSGTPTTNAVFPGGSRPIAFSTADIGSRVSQVPANLVTIRGEVTAGVADTLRDVVALMTDGATVTVTVLLCAGAPAVQAPIRPIELNPIRARPHHLRNRPPPSTTQRWHDEDNLLVCDARELARISRMASEIEGPYRPTWS